MRMSKPFLSKNNREPPSAPQEHLARDLWEGSADLPATGVSVLPLSQGAPSLPDSPAEATNS